MNSFQNGLMMVAAMGGCACVAAVLAILYRRQLRMLHERFMRVPLLGKAIALLGLGIAIVHGSTKTNGTDNASGPEPTNNVPPMMGMMMLSPQPATDNCQSTTVTNWTTRGAWKDWVHLDFPSSFRFPFGLVYIDRVTLVANGEIRTSLTNATALAALPQSVSIEPDVSSVSHGLTPSNTFLVSWTDVCVNRVATNRVEAAIELFADGSVVTTFGNLVGRVAPRPPEGFIGEGQDLAWATNVFPFAASNIVEHGYLDWLDDYIGHDEPNGRYQVKVTVAALPEDGSPCYLFVGPYKTIVKTPGVYAFPLEVFEEYWAYTAPARVPLTFEYDDGYEYDLEPEPLFLAPPMTMAGMTPQEELKYRISQIPRLEVRPNMVIFGRRVNVGMKCNIPDGTWSYWSTSPEDFRMTFLNPTEAEILEAATICTAWVVVENARGRCEAPICVIDNPTPDPPSTNFCHCSSCTNGCQCAITTNGVFCLDCTNGCHCIMVPTQN